MQTSSGLWIFWRHQIESKRVKGHVLTESSVYKILLFLTSISELALKKNNTCREQENEKWLVGISKYLE